MLHTERFEDHWDQTYSASDVKPIALGSRSSNLGESSDLDALLAENLSPNKRAVVQALIHNWEANRKIGMKRTG